MSRAEPIDKTTPEYIRRQNEMWAFINIEVAPFQLIKESNLKKEKKQELIDSYKVFLVSDELDEKPYCQSYIGEECVLHMDESPFDRWNLLNLRRIKIWMRKNLSMLNLDLFDPNNLLTNENGLYELAYRYKVELDESGESYTSFSMQVYFKNHSKEFLKKMESVSDFYNVIVGRGEWHKMEVETFGRKADDYQFFANSHLQEYISKYESNQEKDFYPEGLNFRQKKFSYIVAEFEKLIKIAVKLKVNIPTNMYYDYCAANSSLLAVEMAIKEIKKRETL
tara:strand:+ start:135 stop:974 length:840 start_codon:yes stop_codon:yes gene_type:complete